MADSEDFFKPETVDDQIEQLSLSDDTSSPSQGTTPDARLISDLRHTYQADWEKDARSLDAAWERIKRQYNMSPQTRRTRQHTISDVQPCQYEGYRHMKITQPSSSTREAMEQRVGLIAAVVFLALLVGGMVIVLNFAHYGARNTTTGSAPKTAATVAVPLATPTVTPAVPKIGNIGKIVYTTPSTRSYFMAAWSPDSQRLAVEHDQGIQAWDATTGKHVVVYAPAVTSGCTPGESFVAWSPDGKRIASGINGVGIWDTSSGKLLATYPHTIGNPTKINGGCSGMSSTIGPASTNNGTSSQRAITPMTQYISASGSSPVLGFAWSPDGKEIAASFGLNIDGSIIQVWDTTTGNLVKTYHDTNYVVSMSWSPNGKYVAFGSYDQTVQVWNAASWQPILTYRGNSGAINALAWSPDSTRIISAGNTVTVWNALTDKTLLDLPGSANGVYSLAWSPDGAEIATVVNHVQLWNATTGKAGYTFTANPYPVDTIAWSPNGKYIASVSSPPGPTGGNGIVQVWIA